MRAAGPSDLIASVRIFLNAKSPKKPINVFMGFVAILSINSYIFANSINDWLVLI